MISLRLQRPDPYNQLLFARRQGQGQQLVHTEAASVGTKNVEMLIDSNRYWVAIDDSPIHQIIPSNRREKISNLHFVFFLLIGRLELLVTYEIKCA